MDVNHGGTGERVLPEFRVETLMQISPPRFSKNTAQNLPITPFQAKKNSMFFSWEGLGPLTGGPNPAFLIRLCVHQKSSQIYVYVRNLQLLCPLVSFLSNACRSLMLFTRLGRVLCELVRLLQGTSAPFYDAISPSSLAPLLAILYSSHSS